MNATDTRRFRALIETRLAALAEEAARGDAGTATVTLDQQAIGRLSRQDALQNQAMAKAQQARRASETKRLQAALIRLDDDEYGWCDDCGDPIPTRRLELDLAATRCVSCATG